MSDEIKYSVNGQERGYQGQPMARLLDVLREDLRLTGTKEGCGEGECGACSVLLNGESVCSCLVPMFQLEGAEIQTVEGLAAGDGRLEALQEAFIHESGVQCGACTPGMLITGRALLDQHPKPDRPTIREFLGGNLCRCTGYEAIYRAVEVAAGMREPSTETPLKVEESGS